VVTVTGSGYETTVAPGSSSILARWSEVVGVNYSCAAIYANVTTSATCDVQCAVPNNFHLTNTSGFDAGKGDAPFGVCLGIKHRKPSRSCSMYRRRKVDYNSADLPFASPPFPAGINHPNPTILPVPPIPGPNGIGMDNHSTPGTFVKPYSAKTITATQNYRYTCPCANSGQPVVLYGPLDIVRSVSQNADSSWKFVITKDGKSATINPLP
jgi:hypothetical protein